MSKLTTPTLCIYHANCADGFGAALAVWLRFADSRPEFVPASYGEAPPNCAGHHVLLVDFSYKLPVLEQILAQAKSVTILDHHKTAEADIQPLLDARRVNGEFDMDRSGAAMAWDWCFPDEDRPRLIEYIQDRDLWQFNLEGTREISAALFSYDQDFEVWKNILTALEDDEGQEFILSMGQTLRRKHNKDLNDLLKATKRRMLICGYSVPVANVPYIFASDAGNIMAEGELFSASYFDTPEGRKFSLRSKEGGMDVSEIAKRFGGGGHARAAGFQVPIGWEGCD
jgi:oligoribonuclease NrnB/cAMP/cGMP phosphodiesterase (DHH superfamily)